MSARTVVAGAVAAAVAASLFTPAYAKPKKKPKPKPITKTYDVTEPVPWPAAQAGGICSGAMEGVSMDSEAFTAPAAGVFSATVTKFTGDWDMRLLDSDGEVVSEGSGTDTPNTNTPGAGVESLEVKIKKAGSFALEVCNFAGGPTATVTYTFTFA